MKWTLTITAENEAEAKTLEAVIDHTLAISGKVVAPQKVGAVSTAQVEEPVEEGKVSATETAYDLKKHVIPAFKKYALANSNAKALGILKQFKAASVHDLKPEQYGEVMGAIA